VVWSFLAAEVNRNYINYIYYRCSCHFTFHKTQNQEEAKSQAISHEMHSSQAIFASTVNVDIMAADDA